MNKPAKTLGFKHPKNGKNIEITYVEIPPGGATFHHAYTWHGSGINFSQDHRRAIVAHCVPNDSKFVILYGFHSSSKSSASFIER